MAIPITVDTAVKVAVNIAPLTDDTDFKTPETTVAYNAAGMALYWNFITAAGVYTSTSVTPTTAGDYDWTHKNAAMYEIEIPASGGASINNDAEGVGWFNGVATGVLPWVSPMYEFKPANVIGGVHTGNDRLQVDLWEVEGADASDFFDNKFKHETTLATVASNTSFTLTAGDATDDNYNGWAYAVTDQSTATQKGKGYVSDYTGSTKTVAGVDTGASGFTYAVGDTITMFAPGTVDASQIRAALGLTSANLDTQLGDIPTVSEFEARTLVAADYFDPAADTVANVTTVGAVSGGINTAAGTITTLDGLDTAQDTQHATTQEAIASIGAGAGGALAFEAEADNTGGAIKTVTLVGTVSSGTFADTQSENGVYHQITHATNAIDIIYQFDVGTGLTAVELDFAGYLDGSNDTIAIQVYDYVGTDWETVANVTGQGGTTNISRAIQLLSKHTGTAGADEGKVLVRFVCSGQTSPVLYTDKLLVEAVSVDKTGYSLASTGLDAVTAWTVDITGSLSGSVGSVTDVTGFKLASDGLDQIVPAAPSAIPTFGSSTLPVWIGYMGLWSVAEVNVTSSSVVLRNAADNGDVATHTTSDNGTTFSSGAAS